MTEATQSAMAREESVSNPEVDYERRDLHLTPIAIVAVALLVLLAISPLVTLWGFPGTRHDVVRTLSRLPPTPRLQTNPPADLRAYLDKEQQLLSSYGWADRGKGIARVPISVAMARTAREGIDGFPAPPATSRSDSGDTP